MSYDKDIRGKKAVFLIFWTTWCPHCKEELPLQQLVVSKLRTLRAPESPGGPEEVRSMRAW